MGKLIGTLIDSSNAAGQHNTINIVPATTLDGCMLTLGDVPVAVRPAFHTAWAVNSGFGSTTLSGDFSTDFVSDGRTLNGDSSTVMTTEDPNSLTEGALVASSFTTVGACIDWTSGGELIGIIFFKNDRANSYVERNAANVYHAMHGQTNKTYTYPAVIAESAAGYDVAAKVFGSGSLDKAMETLDIWESILEEHI